MKETFKWTVYVRCLTYNHARYIVEAMTGFIKQQTSFPFVCTIIDDASTDGEPAVIKGFLKENFDPSNLTNAQNEETDDYYLSFLQHKLNKNCYFAVYFLKYNHYSRSETKHKKELYFSRWSAKAKYYALCEGDDYWTDPYKLQKQVDILESNHEIGLVYGKSLQFDEARGIFLRKQIGKEVKTTASLMLDNTIPTATVLVRSSLYNLYKQDEDIQKNHWLMGDYPLWIFCSTISKFHFIDEVLSVYRVLRESASHSIVNRKKQEAFCASATQMKLYFNNRYNLIDESIIVSHYHELLLFNAASFGDREGVLNNFTKILNPSQISKILYCLAKTRLLILYAIYRKAWRNL